MSYKILFIHHGKGLGGAPLSLLYLIQGLDRTNFHPIVVFLYDSPIIEMYKQHGIETIGPLNKMDFPHTKIWWLRWYHVVTLLRSIRDTIQTIFFVGPRILNVVQPDIVHLNTSSLIGWAIAAHKKHIPIAWHIREPLANGYLGVRKRIIQCCVKKYANAIIPICHDNAKPWEGNPKTHVVYNTVNPVSFTATSIEPFITKHNLNASAPKILFLGGLSQEKGTLNILEIFTQLLIQLPSAQLLIAGTWDTTTPSAWSLKNLFPAARYKKSVHARIKALGPSIRLLGPINDVATAMAISAVVVFPATVGHFARPVIEAGFMKKPTIASNMPPLDELIIHEKTGFLIEPHNYQDWEQTLYRLLSDKQLNEQIGQQAFEFCSQQFNYDKHIASIKTIYQVCNVKESGL